MATSRQKYVSLALPPLLVDVEVVMHVTILEAGEGGQGKRLLDAKQSASIFLPRVRTFIFGER